MATSASVWRCLDKATKAQIDLLIDRADRIINVCEIKFSQTPFTITKEYAQKIRDRIAIFKNESRTRKSLAITFITTFGLSKTIHSGIAQNQITADDLFR